MLLAPEDASTFGVQKTLRDKVVNPGARFKGRIQSDVGLGPEETFVKRVIHRMADPGILDLDEAANVLRVLANDPLPQLEDIHSLLSPDST